MLTPMDIHNVEFKTVWRGYDSKQVDDFLAKVLGEYEAIVQANKELKGQIEELKSKLDRYSKFEDTISQTLSAAREISDQLKAASSKEAEAMVKAAQARIAQMWAESGNRIALEIDRIRDLHSREQLMWSRLKATLRSLEEVADKYVEEREQFEEWARAVMEAATGASQPAEGEDPEKETAEATGAEMGA